MSKRRAVSFAAPPSPPSRTRIEPLQRLTIDSGSWVDVPTGAESAETTTLTPVPIPTSIYHDLQRASIITDPHGDSQWVRDRTWKFETRFYLTLSSLATRCAELVFEGLESPATVFLNGRKVLKSDDMFVEYRVDITDAVLFMGKQNTITIEFAPTENLAKSLCGNGHAEAQFTCGPWKPMYIDIYNARLSEVQAISTVSPDLRQAKITLRARPDWADSTRQSCKIMATVVSPSGKRRTAILTPASNGVYAGTVSYSDPELWYPRTHGPQNLCTVTFKFSSGSVVFDTVTKKIGLRRVELIRQTGGDGDDDEEDGEDDYEFSGNSPFSLHINNVPISCKLIPTHSLQPRISRGLEALRPLLELPRLGNQNTIHVRGDGIYESEAFYEICNEAGVLVWQDICIASHHPRSAASILQGVEQNLGRLRWHPSLVLVVGNSKDNAPAAEEGEERTEDEALETPVQPEPLTGHGQCEGLPEVVRRVCNDGAGELVGSAGAHASGVIYWPTSPLEDDSTDESPLSQQDVESQESEPQIDAAAVAAVATRLPSPAPEDGGLIAPAAADGDVGSKTDSRLPSPTPDVGELSVLATVCSKTDSRVFSPTPDVGEPSVLTTLCSSRSDGCVCGSLGCGRAVVEEGIGLVATVQVGSGVVSA